MVHTSDARYSRLVTLEYAVRAYNLQLMHMTSCSNALEFARYYRTEGNSPRWFWYYLDEAHRRRLEALEQYNVRKKFAPGLHNHNTKHINKE